MPTPEVWGPTTWALFHTLAAHIREDAFHALGNQLFQKIVSICGALPCPQCTEDATITLRKVKPHDIDSKKKLIDTLYLFHNYVNAKKNKPLFDYSRMEPVYRERNVVNTFQHFTANYHTRGNMRMMTDSFRREAIVKDLSQWLKQNSAAFVATKIQASPPITSTRHRPLQPQPMPRAARSAPTNVVQQAPVEIPAPVPAPGQAAAQVQEIEEVYAEKNEDDTQGVSMVMREKQ